MNPLLPDQLIEPRRGVVAVAGGEPSRRRHGRAQLADLAGRVHIPFCLPLPLLWLLQPPPPGVVVVVVVRVEEGEAAVAAFEGGEVLRGVHLYRGGGGFGMGVGVGGGVVWYFFLGGGGWDEKGREYIYLYR